jgi:hypothetical protein
VDPIFSDGAAKLRSRAAPSARTEPQILFLTEHYGACSDRAEVLDLPDFAAVRFEVASVDGRAAAVAARAVESSDSPVKSSSIHALA